ncbi:MAG: MaoC family dehydratase N-terminal domain-containing protein [Hyphomonadaceae bacterium]
MAAKVFPVEAGHILMFAHAIGDPNPVYADAASARAAGLAGMIAPPTFAQASAQFDPDYHLRPRIGGAWFGSGKNPTGTTQKAASSGTLHAEQHFEYHRHPVAGDVLTATTRPGRTWEKEGRRSGKLIFTETVTEYRDAAGALVITARGVGVRTERPVDQT